eukprot:jgi/Hompol1/1575/HPOL_005643-RA
MPVGVSPLVGCLVPTALVLVILGILAFVFYPRVPQFSVGGVSAVDGLSTLKFGMPASSKAGLGSTSGPGSALDAFSLSIDLQAAINVTNPNRFGIKVNTLYFSAVLVADQAKIQNGPSIQSALGIPDSVLGPDAKKDLIINQQTLSHPIGSGNASDVFFPPTASSRFNIVFNLNYSPSNVTGLLGDPAFSELLQGCGISSPKRKMLIKYTATTVISLLQLVGITPTFDQQVMIDCPFTDSQIASVVSSIKSMITSATSSRLPA